MTRGVTVRPRHLLCVAVSCFGVTMALTHGHTGHDVLPALGLVAVTSNGVRGIRGLLGSIVVGASVGAVIGYVAITVVNLPVTLAGAVSIGVAFGGGLGVVANYLVAGEPGSADETMTVERNPEHSGPTPSDLFDDHPDPILYLVDAGHGPVVRAANAAYESTFEVPSDAVVDAPLGEAVLAGEQTDAVVETIERDDALDTVVSCRTTSGDRRFRLRTVGTRENGYLLYTPRET